MNYLPPVPWSGSSLPELPPVLELSLSVGTPEQPSPPVQVSPFAQSSPPVHFGSSSQGHGYPVQGPTVCQMWFRPSKPVPFDVIVCLLQ